MKFDLFFSQPKKYPFTPNYAGEEYRIFRVETGEDNACIICGSKTGWTNIRYNVRLCGTECADQFHKKGIQK